MYIEIFVYLQRQNYLRIMQNIVGAPVTGENFYGRTKEIKRALEKLKDGNSLILSAPRRVGKTSFSKKIIELLENENWLGIYINMEHLKDEMALYNELADKLYEKRNIYERISRGAKLFLERTSFTIKDASIRYQDPNARNTIRKNILQIINDAERKEKILFVFDELAVFLNEISKKGQTPEEAKSFLNWLRSVRQESSEKAVWIFCSSISIENYLSKYDLSSTTNDMLPFDIGEMPETEALGLIQKLAEQASLTIPTPVQKHILTLLGVALPHNIQALFSAIIDEMPEGKTTINKKVVFDAYNYLVKNATYFGTWYQRLRDYTDEEANLKKILHFMCNQPEGVTEAQLAIVVFDIPDEHDFARLAHIMRILLHDGYIIKGIDNRYSFRLNLLKDYWAYYNL